LKYRTGVEQLDSCLRGGISPGICEVFGEDSSGKSTLCYSVLREVSDRGLPSILIQSECLPDKKYIASCGVQNCISVVPLYLEAAIDAACKAMESGVKVVVIDSVTGLESEADFNNLIVGERVKYAKFIASKEGLSILSQKAVEHKALVLAVNQIRTPIGEMNPAPTSALNKVMRSVCTTRIQTFREEARTEYGELSYVKVRFHIKNSTKSPPNQTAWGFLFNQRGFDRGFEIVRELLSNGSAMGAGAYFKLKDGTLLGPGYAEAAKQVNDKLAYFREVTEKWRIDY